MKQRGRYKVQNIILCIVAHRFHQVQSLQWRRGESDSTLVYGRPVVQKPDNRGEETGPESGGACFESSIPLAQ